MLLSDIDDQLRKSKKAQKIIASGGGKYKKIVDSWLNVTIKTSYLKGKRYFDVELLERQYSIVLCNNYLTKLGMMSIVLLFLILLIIITFN